MLAQLASDSQVAVLGMGAMGSRIAAKLATRGFRVRVWNRSAARAEREAPVGSVVARSPADAAAGCAAVLSMVRDDAASSEAWLGADGALGAMRPGAIAVEVSTVTPAWARSLAAEAAGRGVAFVECPVLGSRPQAEAGQLIALLGGEPDALGAVAPMVDAFAATRHATGPAGTAASVKLAINLFFATQVAAMGELAAFLARSGVADQVVRDVLKSTPVVPPPLFAAINAMHQKAFAPAFPIELVEKDLSYALDAARAANTPLTLAATALELYRRAIAQGLGELNITAVSEVV